MASPDKRTSDLKKLVSAARAVVTYEVGIPVGCIRVNRVLTWLRPVDALDYPIFAKYLHAAREFPIASDRLQWDRAALAKLDKQLERINHKFRDQIFDACYEIIDRFATITQPSETETP